MLGALELAVPSGPSRRVARRWHPGHIAERYGLFTIIVLGETVLAATDGVQAAIDGTTALGSLAPTIVGGLLIVFSMWWLYFDMPSATIVAGVRRAFAKRLSGAFVWGYGHVVVFASAAAVGAGLAVTIDRITHHAALSALAAGFAVTVPVACYLLAVWALHAPYKPPGPLRSFAAPVGAALILAATASGQPVLASRARSWRCWSRRACSPTRAPPRTRPRTRPTRGRCAVSRSARSRLGAVRRCVPRGAYPAASAISGISISCARQPAVLAPQRLAEASRGQPVDGLAEHRQHDDVGEALEQARARVGAEQAGGEQLVDAANLGALAEHAARAPRPARRSRPARACRNRSRQEPAGASGWPSGSRPTAHERRDPRRRARRG